MVRRSHVVPGSIACCPWWTLGGGALLAAAAVTLSGAATRQVEGAELDDRASRGVEVCPAGSEREDEDTSVSDDEESAGTRLPLASPPRVIPVPDAQDGRPAPAAPSARLDARPTGFQESFSALRPASESTVLSGSAQVPDAR